MGISSQIFIQTTCCEPGVIKWVQFLDGPPPKIWDGKKTSKIFCDFWQLSTLIANISETDPQIENWKSSWSTTTPPTLDKGKTVNFGPQTKKLLTCILTHQSGHYPGYYISAIRGCCALKFLHSLEIDQCYLAHTPNGTGVPQKFNRENLKFGLKFSVCTSMIDIGTNGDIITNFYPDDVSRAMGDNMGTIFGWPAP